MKKLTLATTFVVLAATFATPGFAADKKVGDKARTVAEITFVSKAKKNRSASLSPAVYRTDITAQKQRAKTLLIDVNGKKFGKKFFGHRRGGFGRRGFKSRGFGHGGFHHGGFGHNRYGHGSFGNSGFGHGGFGLGTKLKKKFFFGK